MSAAAVQTGAPPPYSEQTLQSFQQQTVQAFTRSSLQYAHSAPSPNGQLNFGPPPSPVNVYSTPASREAEAHFVAMSQVPQQNSGIVYLGPHSSGAGLGPVIYGASMSPVLYNYGSTRHHSSFGASNVRAREKDTYVFCSNSASHSPGLSPVYTATFPPYQYRRNGTSEERDRPQHDIDMQNRERTQNMNDDIERECARDKKKKHVRSMKGKTALPPHYSKQSSGGDPSDGIFPLEPEHDTQSDEEEPKDPPLSRRKTPTSLQAQRSPYNMRLDDTIGQFSRPLPSQDFSRRAQYDQHKHGREPPRQRLSSDGSFRGSPRGDASPMFPPRDHRHHAPMPPPRSGYDLSPAFESHSYPPPFSHHFDEHPPPSWDRRAFVPDPYEPNLNRRYRSKPARRAGKQVKKAKQKAIEEHKNKNSQTQNYRQKQNLCDQVEKQLEAIPGWDSVKSKTSYRGADVLFLQIKVPAALKQIVKMMEEIMELKDEHGNRQLQNLHMNVQLKKKKLKKGFLLYLKFKTEEQVEAIIKDVWKNYDAIPRCEKAVFKKNTSKPNQGKKSDDGDAQIGGCVREVDAPVANKLCDFVDMKAREKLVDGRLGQGGEAGSHTGLGTASTLV